MKGYFAVGVEGVSKARNLGAVMRTAHAFGASFVFSVKAEHRAQDMFQVDTAKTTLNLPYYPWDNVDDLLLPKGCQLVGVELTEDAIELPSFRHPRAAAYVMGPERGNLSDEMMARCSHVIKIPTRFCVNLSVAAAIALYDRTISMGHYPERPIMPGGPLETPQHVWGPPKRRT
jgi:tRNA G18 (ribose-2'-O)-methylase SpoU